MENKEIIKILKNTALLMELHGENDFKIRSYQSAIQNLERYQGILSQQNLAELENIDGIGKSIAQSIEEIIKSGVLGVHQDLKAKTPEGIVEMLSLSGFGPKKIKAIWENLQIETLEELSEACKANKIANLKGFGQKSQDKMYEAIQFKLSMRGFLYYREAEKLANDILKILDEENLVSKASLTGAARRKMEIINPLELLISPKDKNKLKQYFEKSDDYNLIENESGPFSWLFYNQALKANLKIYLATDENFNNLLLKTSSHPRHLNLNFGSSQNDTLNKSIKEKLFDSEEAIYKSLEIPYVAPELREGLWESDWVKSGELPQLLEMDDLKGILHNHSTYSDGKNTLKEMAEYCKELGYEYLGISDHSKTAAYANGLQEYKIKEQHEEIDKLNESLAPFKIFKGIESDILNDGSLDYSNDILEKFDFIVASIHSPLSMDKKTATDRLLTAIANPFTTILGHPTGRLLLQRSGYPVDHKAIIDACAKFNVVIEINAHPYRLDLDWRHVRYALDQGVMISVNPDAHEKAGYHDMYYGVCVGRKAGLTANETFNAKGRDELQDYFEKRKKSALSKI